MNKAMDCTIVTFLVLILSYIYVMCYHWQDLDQGYMGPHYIIFCNFKYKTHPLQTYMFL